MSALNLPPGPAASPSGAILSLLDEVAAGAPLPDAQALQLAALGPADRADVLTPVAAAARAKRDRVWGRTLTFSPKVFVPLTNVCRNRCDYCSFRRSPGEAGEWTMRPDEVRESLSTARARGCVEALYCLGDRPDVFKKYRTDLASFGADIGVADTVDFLVWAGEAALEAGLLPHTNAGVLTLDEMRRLRPLNVSLGLMLENVSGRLCGPGMPHHRAPDKRPAVRLQMTREAGELRIPFTSGLLLGIGETPRERVETLLAIRDLHEAHGHIQEVIVQPFRERPEIPMAGAPEAEDYEIALYVALARLILPDAVSVQAPPNLNPAATALLIDAGLNDWGGISPVTPDFINPHHPWPQLARLAEACAASGFALAPRLPIYDSYLAADGWLDPRLEEPVRRARERLAEGGLPR